MLSYCLRRRERKKRIFPYRNARFGEGERTLTCDLMSEMKKDEVGVAHTVVTGKGFLLEL
jgi:hypothetical protein